MNIAEGMNPVNDLRIATADGPLADHAAVRHLPTLRGKHVMIVGINYAPEPTGIAPYTTGMAEHLAAGAQSVTVLTGMPHYPDWHVADRYRWVLRGREQSRLHNQTGLMVRRLRHYVPRHQNALTRAAYEASFLANAMATRVWYAPDLVVSVTPSLGGAVAGAHLARRHGARFLVVVQDLMAKAATQSGISGGDAASAATGAIERWALRRADRVAVVSDAFREALHVYGIADQRISTLPNWTHISPATLDPREARMRLGWPPEPFTVVHTGNIGLKQDLGNLVEVARLAQHDPDLRFVIVGDGSQRHDVESRAAGLTNLAFVDPLAEDTYPLALAAADVLVVNERPGVGDMSLPSKLTSYLSAKRPLLAAVARDGATEIELRHSGGAALIVPPGDPRAFLDGLTRLRADEAQRDRMARTGQSYARSQLGPEAAATRLDALVQECLAG